jgi:NADH:ubiquinone oxidoreductase subunit 6 (subunit J)
MLIVALATASLTSLLLTTSPTVAVVWLILTYVSSALYICYLGQAYLAAIIVLVNVGAVALLVLFASLLLSQRLLGADTSGQRTPILALSLAAGAATALWPSSQLGQSGGLVTYAQTDAISSVAHTLYSLEPMTLVGLALLLTLAVGVSLLLTRT